MKNENFILIWLYEAYIILIMLSVDRPFKRFIVHSKRTTLDVTDGLNLYR